MIRRSRILAVLVAGALGFAAGCDDDQTLLAETKAKQEARKVEEQKCEEVVKAAMAELARQFDNVAKAERALASANDEAAREAARKEQVSAQNALHAQEAKVLSVRGCSGAPVHQHIDGAPQRQLGSGPVNFGP